MINAINISAMKRIFSFLRQVRLSFGEIKKELEVYTFLRKYISRSKFKNIQKEFDF